MVFSDEAINTDHIKDKCHAAIASLTRQHGLSERLSEACFMLALSEVENGWRQRAEAAEALNNHLELAVRKAEGVSEALRRRAEAAGSDLELGMLEYQAKIAGLEAK